MEARMVLAWSVLTTLGGCCPGAPYCEDSGKLTQVPDDTATETTVPPLPCRPEDGETTEPLTDEENWSTALEPDGDPDAQVVLGCGDDPSDGCETLYLDSYLSDADSVDWFGIDGDDAATYLVSDPLIDVDAINLPATFHLAARRGRSCDGVDVVVYDAGFNDGRRTVINPSFVSATTSKASCNFVAGISGCLTDTVGLGYGGSDRYADLPPYYFDLEAGAVTDVGFTTGTSWSYSVDIATDSGSTGSLPGGYAGTSGSITVNGIPQTQWVITAWNVKAGGALTVQGTKYDATSGHDGSTYTTSCKLGGKGTVTLVP